MRTIRFLSLSIAIAAALSAGAYNQNYFAQTSRLNTGKWVKVKVTQNGIHQITYDQLRQWGFTNPENVVVYGYGGNFLGQDFRTNFPDDVPPTPMMRYNNKICFYAESGVKISPTNVTDPVADVKVNKNQSSLNAGYYLLSDCSPSDMKLPTNYPFSESGLSAMLTNHHSFRFIKENCTNNGKGGANWFGPSFNDVPAQHYYINAYDPVEGVSGSLLYRWVARSSLALSLMCYTGFHEETGSTTIKNMTRLTSASTYNYAYGMARIDANLSADTDQEGGNNYDIEFSKSGGEAGCYAAIDYISFYYQRKNKFLTENGQMPMWFCQPSSTDRVVLENANDNIRVWNVSGVTEIANFEVADYEGEENAKQFRFPSNYADYQQLIVFDPSENLLPVEFVENVNNQNLHAITAPVDMIVITTKTLRPYAEELAQAHRECQGMNVAVVVHDDIFNEFSAGNPSTAAYRRFARMLYVRHPESLKYLLLYGPASYDNSRIIFTSNDNLLTYEAEYDEDARENTRSYCSDAFFGLIDSNFNSYYTSLPLNTMVIGVGRIAAPSTSVAQQVNRKLIKILRNPQEGPALNKAIYLCDDGDSNGHLEQAEELTDSVNSIAPHIVPIKVYNDLYPFTNYDAVSARSKITQSLNAGLGLFSYTGHGNPSAFNVENIWAKRYINENSYNYIPFATLSTCDSFSFDRGDNGMAETFLYKEDGGMIGIVGASRTVYKVFNQYLNKRLTEAYCKIGPDDCTGDVFRIGHNMSFYGFHSRDLGTNTMCYNLCGDPAMPLFGPKYKMKVVSVNNQEIVPDVVEMVDDGEGNLVPQANATLIPIYPRAHNTVVGYVIDDNGNVVTNYNGTATISLYDAPDSISNLRQGGDAAIKVQTCHDMLSECTATIVNGQFTADVVFPTALRPDNRNKMTLYAFNGNMKERAVGAETHISVKPYDESVAIHDDTPPTISEMYINTTDFREGDMVEPSFMFYATIEPEELGVCTATSIIGSSTNLTLDGKKSFADATSALIADSEGKYHINFPIDGLEDGAHTLTLDVADNAGNRATRSISFIVVNFNVEATLAVAENPARNVATFSVTDNLQGSENQFTLIVERKNGTAVYTNTAASFPYEWDLKDNDGNLVDDGEYFAFVRASNGKQFGSSPKIKLIVVKKAE